jgi:hypothetical protein
MVHPALNRRTAVRPHRRVNNRRGPARRVVLAVAGVLVGVFAFKGSNVSPEDQIRANVKTWDDDLNNADPAGLRSLICAKDSSDYQPPTSDELRKQRDEMGIATSSVTDIHVTGDRATGKVSSTRSKLSHSTTVTLRFVRENGSWKQCGLV